MKKSCEEQEARASLRGGSFSSMTQLRRRQALRLLGSSTPSAISLRCLRSTTLPHDVSFRPLKFTKTPWPRGKRSCPYKVTAVWQRRYLARCQAVAPRHPCVRRITPDCKSFHVRLNQTKIRQSVPTFLEILHHGLEVDIPWFLSLLSTKFQHKSAER